MSARARGIVLAWHPFREHSQILRILTSDGKISLLAKGALRARGRRWYGGYEPGDEIAFLYYARPRGGLHLMGEARFDSVRPLLRRSLAAWGAMLYGLCLADTLTVGEDPNGAPYIPLSGFLDDLEAGCEPRLCALALEAELLRNGGFLPGLEACPGCGGAWSGGAARATVAPGIACPRCARSPRRVAEDGVDLLRRLADGADVSDASVHAALEGAVRLSGWLLLAVLGRMPRGRRFAYGAMHREEAA
ncbi:MAG: DNA repair protein RecO [Planctomycetes bacterium]|nr:DNA repair protein RecO [Planctomycetota bacterium]